MVEQQADRQCGTIPIEVDGVQHVAGYRRDAEQRQQLGLVALEAPRQQQPAFASITMTAV
ncbi:hypothetical protein AB0L14_37875 [Streptomyces sp. NPDC052727]|uniref:hypothetical protein n=1 Tax=Streptomyces sp. NPDC052727 TaxID=3154854 RepID=UPI003440324D